MSNKPKGNRERRPNRTAVSRPGDIVGRLWKDISAEEQYEPFDEIRSNYPKPLRKESLLIYPGNKYRNHSAKKRSVVLVVDIQVYGQTKYYIMNGVSGKPFHMLAENGHALRKYGVGAKASEASSDLGLHVGDLVAVTGPGANRPEYYSYKSYCQLGLTPQKK